MTSARVDPPLAFLAELTHRCPLQCPYCSNPLQLNRPMEELATAEWKDLFEQAASLGVMQAHLSGGEPTARRDLVELVHAAERAGIYCNLVTSGVLLDRPRLNELAAAGLRHIQLSIQDAEAAEADRVADHPRAHARKLAIAAEIRASGFALTVNAVMHRQNLPRLGAIIALAEKIGAERLEVAHVQYHGWALLNRAALLPTAGQVQRARELVSEAQQRLSGRMRIDYVASDYHATRPKACMGGWGRRFFVVAPNGDILPCHAARSIPRLTFPNVKTDSLASAWETSPGFAAFRGTDWLPQPCQSCEYRDIDFGGCRCQALALTGDAAATDPACELSPLHARLRSIADSDSYRPQAPFRFRRFGLFPDFETSEGAGVMDRQRQ